LKRFKAAADKLAALHKHIQMSDQLMLAGGLLTELSRDELLILDNEGYLSLNEKQLIQRGSSQ
jgi:hypothetical protein